MLEKQEPTETMKRIAEEFNKQVASDCTLYCVLLQGGTYYEDRPFKRTRQYRNHLVTITWSEGSPEQRTVESACSTCGSISLDADTVVPLAELTEDQEEKMWNEGVCSRCADQLKTKLNERDQERQEETS